MVVQLAICLGLPVQPGPDSAPGYSEEVPAKRLARVGSASPLSYVGHHEATGRSCMTR